MRLVVRILFAAALAAVPVSLVAMSCGTDAAGIDACRQIEDARCQAAPLCTPGFDVDRCTRFYRDECLVGVENADSGTDPNTLSQGCVNALNALAACIDGGLSTSACPGAALMPDASCSASSGPDVPCNVILYCPEALSACNFVVAPISDGGTDAGMDASDASDGS